MSHIVPQCSLYGVYQDFLLDELNIRASIIQAEPAIIQLTQKSDAKALEEIERVLTTLKSFKEKYVDTINEKRLALLRTYFDDLEITEPGLSQPVQVEVNDQNEVVITSNFTTIFSKNELYFPASISEVQGNLNINCKITGFQGLNKIGGEVRYQATAKKIVLPELETVVKGIKYLQMRQGEELIDELSCPKLTMLSGLTQVKAKKVHFPVLQESQELSVIGEEIHLPALEVSRRDLTVRSDSGISLPKLKTCYGELILSSVDHFESLAIVSLPSLEETYGLFSPHITNLVVPYYHSAYGGIALSSFTKDQFITIFRNLKNIGADVNGRAVLARDQLATHLEDLQKQKK